ncbi:MAG: 23S rRNA (guanosine(2251)-2'-O)-methyltransferase RlmB [Oscillospiraceae bacterium]|nr:23S rRNA (guanosine(2251)-2'-O)-methyltransferase RlmB [Oscillospiraceae bacterium]
MDNRRTRKPSPGKGGSREHSRTESRRRPEREERRLPAEDIQQAPEGLIIGRNPVLEALKAGKPIDTLYIDPEATGSIRSIVRIARERGIVVKSVSGSKLSQMCENAAHQGVIASGACAEYVTIEDILDISHRKGTKPFIIVCDEIEDPHNLGAVIRTAEAVGADGVVIPKRRSASLNATVFKTSAGAASLVPVARVPNIVNALEELKKQGVWVFGTAMDGADYTTADLTGAVALVIGSEGTGISRLVREKCDHLVSLPMNGKINSLNASVAAGIFMYEAVRQRRG